MSALSRSALIVGTAATVLILSGCAGASGGGSSAEADGSLGLVKDGTLTICANLDSPPHVYAEEDGAPIGVEVDIAKAMAAQMELEPKYNEYAFSGLIPALQAQQCDTIISALYIKPEREEIAAFVPYLLSGSGVAVAKENPANITGYDDSLCGVRAVGITGATGAGLLEEKSAECVADGKDAINITLVDKATDALQQVIAGQLDVFMDTSETVGFFEKQSGGDVEVAGQPVGEIQIGAASLKDNAALHDALEAAFQAIVDDGTYESILDEWGFSDLNIANAS
jgi:polar amino acid transport system substrate-binding protein